MIQRAWRPLIQAISAMLAVMSVALLPTQMIQGSRVAIMENFGSAHRSHTWVLAAPPSEVDSPGLTSAILGVVRRAGVSLAYSAEPAAGVVQVFDPAGRFGLEHSAYADLTPGSDRAMFSPAMARVVGTDLVIPETDRFHGTAPAMVIAVADASLSSGYFLITGGEEVDWDTAVQDLESCWEKYGLGVVAEDSWAPSSPVAGLMSAKLPALVVAAMFVVVPWFALFLAGQLHARAAQGHATSAAVVGATGRELLRELLARVVGTAVLGCLCGALCSWSVSQVLMPADDPVQQGWFAVVVAAGCLVAVGLAALNSVIVIRQVRREVVC